jgi:hypothetical protein
MRRIYRVTRGGWSGNIRASVDGTRQRGLRTTREFTLWDGEEVHGMIEWSCEVFGSGGFLRNLAQVVSQHMTWFTRPSVMHMP